MFSLAIVKDSVRVHPRHMSASTSLKAPVVEELNNRFCNRIIPDIGLCVSVFDVTELGDPFVHPGEAQPIVEVTFRLVVMRPFVGEVLVGKIRSCTEEGISVSLVFFDDVFIPAHCLQSSSRFDSNERLWVWCYDGNDLYMDLDEPVRFRVLGDAFSQVAPAKKEAAMLKAASRIGGFPNAAPSESDSPSAALAQVSAADLPQSIVSPYKVVGTMAEAGLGLISWWNS